MQEVKFLLREIGEGAMSSEALEEYIAYNFASKGYELWHQYEVPVLKDGKIKGIQLFLTFVKNDDGLVPLEEVAVPQVGEAKRRGRPAKVS